LFTPIIALTCDAVITLHAIAHCRFRHHFYALPLIAIVFTSNINREERLNNIRRRSSPIFLRYHIFAVPSSPADLSAPLLRHDATPCGKALRRFSILMLIAYSVHGFRVAADALIRRPFRAKIELYCVAHIYVAP